MMCNGAAFGQKCVAIFGSVQHVEMGNKCIGVHFIDVVLHGTMTFDTDIECALKLGHGPFDMCASVRAVGVLNNAQCTVELMPLFLLCGVSVEPEGQYTQNTAMREVANTTAGGEVLELNAIGRIHANCGGSICLHLFQNLQLLIGIE